ncbi:hypothetical protein GCM10008015_31870 [Flavobacterium palustre]|uniref:Glycosyl transferase family 1 n=1 Tax=Flavobacterium palustre TaxID=1476463 RepID=A0ABQ1HUD2_9FLAO|nr:glycosyltransferase family 4 protein [Flavobacterium palustre]GGA88976.1 hypothetical protein GCM10008015_31870 [Flavobacterium palustre]
MKILLVAIPNHHFFQWTNQLKESGYEVYWFDITDGAGFVEKINWVKQFNGWKLKWDYPFRHRLKNKFPKIYTLLERIRTRKVENVFEDIISKIQPDLVHCFEMKLAGLPILSTMRQNNIPLVYSSWGSDMFYFEKLGLKKEVVEQFLNRVDFFISDCKRDYNIIKQLGYSNEFLGVFPGNGGIEIESEYIQLIHSRKIICIKGYEDGFGKALLVLEAIESMQLNDTIDFLIFSADEIVKDYLKKSLYFKTKKVEIISRNSFMPNKLLLQKLGRCSLYIGNSISDGMPNSLLEAMGMGVFPIQSNPGKVTEEVITHGVNGFLIENPNDIEAIANLIRMAIENQEMRVKAQEYNVQYVQENYNRAQLQQAILNLYERVKLN